LASSSSFFFLMSWFLRRCSRTRCSSGLLSTPRPLEWGSCQETLPSPPSQSHPCFLQYWEVLGDGTIISHFTEKSCQISRHSASHCYNRAGGGFEPRLSNHRDQILLNFCVFS
jgi:hypothetical protein